MSALTTRLAAGTLLLAEATMTETQEPKTALTAETEAA